MTLTLHLAGPDDLTAIMALYADPAFGHAPEFGLEAARERLAQIHSNPNHRIFVVREGAACVGTFAVLAMPSMAGDGSATGIVEDVVVSAEARGHGVGEWMMQAAMDQARALGCCKLMLSTAAHRVRAHAFYERVGFEKHGNSYYVPLESEQA